MMSTISGLVLGIVTAAVVTVFYGEELSARLRDLLGIELEVRSTAMPEPPTSLQELLGALPARDEEPPLEASPDAQVAGERPMPPAHAGTSEVAAGNALESTIEERWAEYQLSGMGLEPAGDFPHRPCFVRAAAAHDVPESLLLAVARGESNFDIMARSPKDAVGLMQIRWPGTSRHLGIHREADLYDPCTNVDAGARYIAELRQRYEGDLHRTMAAYNYGPARITSGPLPDGAVWYSQYIYQNLQKVLGQPHVATSELVGSRPGGDSRYHVLMTFNTDYHARAFLQYISRQVPAEVELAQRSEELGKHEVVLLYGSAEEKQRGLQTLRGTELLALATDVE
jgi:hypothetical protein